MTPEEKARAYDEVVNKLRRFMTQGVDPLITRADVQDFFPELFMNEDEKIRKAIISYIDYESQRGGEWFGVKVDDIITWLKKQRESNPYNGVSFEYNGNIWSMCARNNGVDILLNRKLIQHVSPKHVIDEGKAEMDYCFTKMMNGEKISSTWSEEDERKLEESISLIRNNNTGTFYYEKDVLSSFLKSLKQRIKEQQ